MKVNTTSIEDFFSQLRQHLQRDGLNREDVNEKPPLRSELFSAEQMDQHAQFLAGTHKLTNNKAPELLLGRLAVNEDVLFHVTRLLQDAVKEKKVVTPAGEWLLDNFYLIEEQIRLAKRHLPKGYSKGLPRLEKGKSAGLPRVYEIATEIISHSDGHVDMHNLSSFIASYQKLNPLTLGELWAVPIMLRLALLENLSRVAARIAIDRADEDLANDWAHRILETAEKHPKDLVLDIADMARSNPPMVSAFVAAFTRQLQWKGPDLTLPASWIEQSLSESGQTINALVQQENQKQAADQVSMSNSISSLRFLVKTDWREFVETMSMVEQTLRADPAAVYPNMDFHTRDQYRHVVERIAKQSGAAEYEVARIALEFAKEHSGGTRDVRTLHVGYYLVGEGVKKTEAAVRIRLTTVEGVRRWTARRRYAWYVLGATVLTLLIMVIGVAGGYSRDVAWGWWLTTGVVALLGASQFALSIVNWLSTLTVKPHQLPKMDFSGGIPDENRTLVVVPTLLVNPRQVEKLLEDLEVRFLANRDPNLLFGLLTDLKDADQQILPADSLLIQIARDGIIALNKKYDRDVNDTFFLFHRPRMWNPVEKIWMGYERKRGKLSELNQLLRGGAKARFSVIAGEEHIYKSVQYIITLDTDTQLPRDAGWMLVGMMAHPLNQPVYSDKKRRVVQGYSIIQPRIAISLHGATRTRYTRMHENDSGIDPYTQMVSDVYQDVFSEGSFIGKGIYHVDTFEKVLNNRFPENRILSHDLLEGSYTRCGYASDVQFYEEYPARYSVDVSRRHRWIRGDWQIGNWSLPWIPDARGRFIGNPLNALSRWKIFDNLRRSLVPVALVLLYLLAWLVLPATWFWTVCATGVILLPALVVSIWGMVHKPTEINFRQHLVNNIRSIYHTLAQAGLTIVCLPYEAMVSLDAIGRTGWRVVVSHRRLLEWNPSGFVQNGRPETLPETYVTMLASPLFAILTSAAIIHWNPAAWAAAAPFLLVWMLAPAAVWWLNQPLPTVSGELNADRKDTLRELARKTWAFFEDLVAEPDNWLPPDNLQEYPIPVVAHRTSPTNIGLSLLANLTAVDFGYIPAAQFLQRTEHTFSTLNRLERYKGHFYNWYDTQSLQVLQPRYVSTVDSGNLAGHLITLRQGLLQMPDRKVIERQALMGLQDTVRIILHKLPEIHQSIYQSIVRDFTQMLQKEFIDLEALRALLSQVRIKGIAVLNRLDSRTETHRWIVMFDRQIQTFLTEIDAVAPWLTAGPIPAKFQEMSLLTDVPTFAQILQAEHLLEEEMTRLSGKTQTPEEVSWIGRFRTALHEAASYSRRQLTSAADLAEQCAYLADMEYDFLYDKSQHLLTIGYNVESHRADASYYDLLASEARLATFVAIAQDKLPQKSWFALGRRLTTAGNTPVLLSWSGSMFEYLMPMLVMPSYRNTLLDETMRGTVQRQIEYGRQRNVPWGISESCYNVVDAHLTYQYRAFGVPGLGFKRGLGDDLVIAPYATVMALMVAPDDAYNNLATLREQGFEGQYGFFEAADYTPSRLPRGQSRVLVQTFMAHHQGMSLLSLAYVLLDQPMQKRFEADPQCQTVLLLLQERVPRTTSFYSAATEMQEVTLMQSVPEMRVINTADTQVPEVQLLSNGRYHVMLTNAGGGYSRWRDMAVTRWREDTTCDNWGTFCYIRDLDRNEYWSTAHQPVLRPAERYEALFSQGRVEFRRRDIDIETHTEIIVSPEDDVEIRRIHLVNRSGRKRHMEVTSYAEVVLAAAIADAAHPAFSNLFVQTAIEETHHAILATRRARSHDEQPPWMLHMMKISGQGADNIAYETDRDKFIGRGHTLASPRVMRTREPLGNSQGSVLDPVVSVQYRITLPPGESVTFDVVTGMAKTREETQILIDKYQDPHLRDRAFELSWTHSQVVLRQINAAEGDAQLFGRLASAVIYTNPFMRVSRTVQVRNQRGQSALWAYAISGDLPIVLLRLSDSTNVTLARQMVQAHAYWQLKGLAVDLVILNEDQSGYRQVLQDQIQSLIAAGVGLNSGRQGGIFIRSADQVSGEDWVLLQTVARIIISDTRGSLNEQIKRRPLPKPGVGYLQASAIAPTVVEETTEVPPLLFFNGHGGFTADGREYIIRTSATSTTPLPWINVIANNHFGTVVTESGPSYTWIENAHEYRLTPWYNDPVTGRAGEAFYIRDEETGRYWSPTPQPAIAGAVYTTRHGFGYTVFEHQYDGIRTEVWIYVDREAAVKFTTLKIRNISGRPRKLSTTAYVEWVLADLREKSLLHIVAEQDLATRAIIARNAYSMEFSNYVAFLDVDAPTYTYTTDRQEFLGRNGTLQQPDAMRRLYLSGKAGAGLDPCAAIQVPVELDNGAEQEVIFRLGGGRNVFEATETIRKFKGPKAAREALTRVHQYWSHTLSSVRINTPDSALNILTNGWLLYQVMSSRLWGRSGFYQSGGAYGFRDQLQDVLALVHAAPAITRQQILLAASRQFREGDVQHWWHPPLGRGVRTQCSDDFLWLPFVVSRYVEATGDAAILDEEVSFLEGRPLNMHEESYYDLPAVSDERASLYEHCRRAVRRGLLFGENGLPLIGSGDWNDGMSMVGIHGKGESVWLAFFLYDVLRHTEALARARNDEAFASECAHQASQLKRNIHDNAWDGGWYIRAYYDDGTPLGSSRNVECRIDSISQSWSVLSEGGDPERSQVAMEAVNKHLVRRDRALIQLLDPPFDKSEKDPGYIKGYVPGVRENGGQYTHAAVWMIMAFAKLGDHRRTWELLNMINPLNHGRDPKEIAVYKAEPYVIAADVYGVAPHEGRGGWTWYTGSAGWVYQLIIEWFFGLKRQGDRLLVTPCLPPEWPSVTMQYRFLETVYALQLDRVTGGEEIEIWVDDVRQEGHFIDLVNDKVDHLVRITVKAPEWVI
ncbi:GH36-type glycosyl hydrolase domain-containing protein [Parachryseolinea silvisoli]|uniref:GH36-type glycosyl hydrolase domain-containing protein n=1 Tax=Parachryseolinea silvisoli TaxID=2873601 RepID=UPI002265F14F|nr:glucoamylase family protein [Parachryseolinea silvisoli]MCD9019388.1 cyclic beta 1-2 glucan synthetase [Parachryseolinea silvisoli]